MTRIKKFNNYRVNESIAVASAALLLGGGILWLTGEIYKSAKNFWSKNVVGAKYKPTGNKEVINTTLPKDVSYVNLLSIEEREKGIVKTVLTEYEDNIGNLYWGYDHLHSEDQYADPNEYAVSKDLYTAMFRQEDLPQLKNFLQDGNRYTGKGTNVKLPKPAELIFKQKYNVESI